MKKLQTKIATKKNSSKTISRKKKTTKVLEKADEKVSQSHSSQFNSVQEILIEQVENKRIDFNKLAEEMEIKKKLTAMFEASSIESYLASNDPSDVLREARKEYLELLIQSAKLAGEVLNPKEPNNVNAFVEGLTLSKSERIQEMKGYFLTRLFLFAKLPLDPREEIALIIEALKEVTKTLPKRKPGRKVDELMQKAWLRVDQEKIPYREAYHLFRLEEGLSDEYTQEEFKEFQGKIRKKRSEENIKQGREKVTGKRKLQSQKSGS